MAKDKTQILVIYPGRFQPFHKGHKAVYEYLTGKYDNVYVATSDKVDPPRSPFSFNEKKMMMELTGMDTTNVVLTKSPYVAMEITQNFDKENTILMFATSEKDMAEDPRFTFKPKKDGSPSYFQAVPEDGKMETMDKHGYMITVPTFNFNVLGKPMTSATEIRSSFAGMDDDTKKKLIQDLFGNYSDEVFNLMSGKITEDAPQFAQQGNHPHQVFAGLDGDIRDATATLEDLFMKVKDSPVGTKVRKRFMIAFHGALNALKQQMSITLELRENYGLDKVSFPDILTLKRKQTTVNLVLSESNIKVLETGKILPVTDLTKIYKRGFRKITENKKMESQKLGVFAKGRNKVSIWEADGSIVLLHQESQHVLKTKGSVADVVNTLYNRGYICESMDMTTLKNAAGAIMNVFFDTVKNTTTVRDQEGGSHTYQATGDKVIAALLKKGYQATQDDIGGLSLEPMPGQQDPGQMGMHGKMLNASLYSRAAAAGHRDFADDDQKFGVWSQVSGGARGHQESWAKKDGERIELDTYEEAQALAREYTQRIGMHGQARFVYSAMEIDEAVIEDSEEECDTCADLGYIPTTGEVCPDCNDGEELMAARSPRPTAQRRIRSHKLKF